LILKRLKLSYDPSAVDYLTDCPDDLEILSQSSSNSGIDTQHGLSCNCSYCSKIMQDSFSQSSSESESQAIFASATCPCPTNSPRSTIEGQVEREEYGSAQGGEDISGSQSSVSDFVSESSCDDNSIDIDTSTADEDKNSDSGVSGTGDGEEELLW